MFESFLNFIINPALANQAPAQQANPMGSFLILAVFGLVLWFFIIRPQSKRMKEHRQMIQGLNVGDEVVTNGGILAKISKIHDDMLALKIADNVEIKMQKHAVSAVLPKGTVNFVAKTTTKTKKQ